jgi:mutator family transposase
VVRVRLDRKATAISLLVVIGVRADGQKMLIAIKSMGGESTEARRAVLDDLIQRGLRRPEFLIIDGASGLENAIAAVWDGVPVQRCTVGSLKKWPVRPSMPQSTPVMASHQSRYAGAIRGPEWALGCESACKKGSDAILVQQISGDSHSAPISLA